jgi:TRAP-type mannitol/chloroaromatic compound transport system permease small subunit
VNATAPLPHGAPRSILQRAALAVTRVSNAIGSAAAWATVPMILLAVATSLTAALDKYAGTSISSNALSEAQWYLFAFVFLLGAPATLAKGAHVRVDAWYGKRSARTRHWIDLVGGVLFLLPFCAFGFYESLTFVENSWALMERSPNPGGLPRYPVKTLVPIAFALLFVQGLAQVVLHAVALRRGEGSEPAR